MIEFEWSLTKARANQERHGVSFEEALSVFYDEFAVQFYDDKHSEEEHRFILLGMSDLARVVVVCHCEINADVIRIISARKATRRERLRYESTNQ